MDTTWCKKSRRVDVSNDYLHPARSPFIFILMMHPWPLMFAKDNPRFSKLSNFQNYRGYFLRFFYSLCFGIFAPLDFLYFVLGHGLTECPSSTAVLLPDMLKASLNPKTTRVSESLVFQIFTRKIQRLRGDVSYSNTQFY